MAVHFRSLRKSLGVLIYPVTASIALAILVSAAGAAYAQTPDSIWKESLDNIEGSGLGVPIEQVFEEIFKQEGPSFKDIVQGILTGKGVKLKDCLKLLLGQALGNISGYAKILGQIILIGVTISCLNILGQTMAPDGSSRIAQTSAHMVLVLVAVLSFRDVLNVSVEAVNGLRTAFFAFIPVVTGMVLASGAPVTAGVLYPTVFGMGTFVSVFILDVAFPLIFTSIAIDLAGNLGGGERVSGVADVLRQTAFVGMGLLLSAFVGVVAGTERQELPTALPCAQPST